MSGLIVNIKRLHPDAVIPRYATELAAGFDLVAVRSEIIAPGQTIIIPLGFSIEIPEGYELQIRPRSGVSLSTKLRVSNSPGTIDVDFRGEVKVLVDNIAPLTDKRVPYIRHIDGNKRDLAIDTEIEGSYFIRKGDRIAQGVIAPVERAIFVVVDELSETARGSGGFGHTGVSSQ
ncbi:dUTP diphosphatase [uncultured Paenibacillus sp.]|uniref:dUTP diphosphatase n=1 Tax=uncultured Paenibacillus sp. TaxID=227322 RepID=UPI0015AF1E76|nr:deoxyuridine 5'-triphosphate nucleotidohydrolase [uncultured Paenibacillus sp.]DAW22595.1 MAG TPA: dUTPase [Caudoviricetes sp.]